MVCFVQLFLKFVMQRNAIESVCNGGVCQKSYKRRKQISDLTDLYRQPKPKPREKKKNEK